MSRPNRRHLRSYLIHGDLQLRVVSMVAIYALLSLLIALVAGFYPVFSQLFLSSCEPVRYEAAQTFLRLFDRFLPAALGLIVLLAVHMLVVSHRVAGPLRRFNRVFAAVAEGDLDARAELRRSDYLQEEGRRINRMVEAVAGRFEQVRTDYARMEADLTRLRDSVSDPECRRQIERLLAVARQGAAGVAPPAADRLPGMPPSP